MTDFRAVGPEVKVLAGKVDDCLARSPVFAIPGKAALEAVACVQIPLCESQKRYVPFLFLVKEPHCRPPAGNLNDCLGVT